MKSNNIITFLVLLIIGVALFFGVMQLYGRSTNGRENILEDWNNVSQKTIKTPTTVATLRRNRQDRLFRDWDPLDQLLAPNSGDRPNGYEEGEVSEVTGEGAERIVSAAKKVWQEWVNKGGYYTQAAATWKDGSTHRMDCSSYVSTVLREAGYDVGMQSSSNLSRALLSHGFVLVGSAANAADAQAKAQAGDVLVYQGHTQIAVGDGLTYNWGGCGKVPSPTFPNGGYCANHGITHPQTVPPTKIAKNKTCAIYRLKGD